MSHIGFRANNLHPFYGRRVLEDFFDLQLLSLKIPSHFSVELNLSVKLWRQIDESHKCLEHHTSEHSMKYVHQWKLKTSVCLISAFIHPICLLLRAIGCGSLHKMFFLGKLYLPVLTIQIFQDWHFQHHGNM